MTSEELARHWTTPAEAEGRPRISPPSLGWLGLKGYSGALTAALVGLDVVVAALLADPVADQVLGTLEFLRPCIAGNQARGLPHHVELAIALDLADEHRLGDVMVGKHLGVAAGQIGVSMPGSASITLSGS